VEFAPQPPQSRIIKQVRPAEKEQSFEELIENNIFKKDFSNGDFKNESEISEMEEIHPILLNRKGGDNYLFSQNQYFDDNRSISKRLRKQSMKSNEPSPYKSHDKKRLSCSSISDHIINPADAI